MEENKTKLTIEQAQAAVNQWIRITNASDGGDAEIEIDGDIGYDWWTGDDSNTAKAIKARLKEIANMKAKTIYVRINSLGGYIQDGLAIHDALALNKAEIITDIQGVAASMATVIAQSGATRRISDNALYLIHQASAGAMGNINEIEAQLNDLKTWNDRLVNIYVKRNSKGKTEEDIRDLMNRDNGYGEWLTADEALEMGLVDEVYEPMRAAASVKPIDRSILKALHLPEIPEEKKSHLKTNIMSDEKKSFREMFDDFKVEIREMVTNLLKGRKEEDHLPEEITNKLMEWDQKMTEQEAEKDQLQEQVSSLTSELQTANDTIEANNTEIESLKAKNLKLEGDLTKKNSKSTKTESPEGKENPDAPVNKEMEALNKDAAKIRKSLMTVTADEHSEADEDGKD